MKKILVVVSHYLPGYKAGGPIRTIANLVEWLGNEFQFYILTSDRDLGDCQPYANIRPGTWQTVSKAQVLYLSPPARGFFAWRRLLRTLDYDLLYLNGFFLPISIKTLLLRRIGQIPAKPIVLAPRGEFSPGALILKRFKKRLFIFLAKRLRLYQGIIWQASSEIEMQNILSIFSHDLNKGYSIVRVASNLPSQLLNEGVVEQRPFKQAGVAHIVFLSRIARKKNLDLALRLLANVPGQIKFDIYGPIEDRAYWQECQRLISQLPSHVQVTYKGSVNAEQVLDVFSQYHLFLFPSAGENFGHVILEAMCAGCPVLISDQTPWHRLAETRAGWDVPLAESTQFSVALNDLITMDEHIFREWSQSAREYGLKFATSSVFVEANRKLFLEALMG